MDALCIGKRDEFSMYEYEREMYVSGHTATGRYTHTHDARIEAFFFVRRFRFFLFFFYYFTSRIHAFAIRCNSMAARTAELKKAFIHSRVLWSICYFFLSRRNEFYGYGCTQMMLLRNTKLRVADRQIIRRRRVTKKRHHRFSRARGATRNSIYEAHKYR